MNEAESYMVDLRKTTVDEIVTRIKLSKVAVAVLDGFTTPEGFPFVVVVSVGKPGNERLLELTHQFREDIRAAGSPVLASAESPAGWARVHRAAEVAKNELGEMAPTADLINHMIAALDGNAR